MNTENEGQEAQLASRLPRGFLTWPAPQMRSARQRLSFLAILGMHGGVMTPRSSQSVTDLLQARAPRVVYDDLRASRVSPRATVRV